MTQVYGLRQSPLEDLPVHLCINPFSARGALEHRRLGQQVKSMSPPVLEDVAEQQPRP